MGSLVLIIAIIGSKVIDLTMAISGLSMLHFRLKEERDIYDIQRSDW